MEYIVFAFFVLLCIVLSLVVKGDISRWWMTSFAFWWGILLSLSLTNPFDLHELSFFSYMLFLLYVLAYIVGFLVSLPKKKVNARGLALRSIIGFAALINNKLIKFTSAVVTAALFFYAYKYSSVISLVGSLDSRVVRFEVGEVFGSNYEILLFEYIIGSLIWFAKFIVAFGVVFSMSRNLLWRLSLVSCLLYMMFGAGRNIALEIGLFVFILLVLRKFSGERGGGIVDKSMVVVLLAALYFSSVLATSFRLSEQMFSMESLIEANLTLMEHLVIYFLGAFRAFDYAVANYNDLFFYEGGLLTAAGLEQMIALFLRLLGFDILPYSNYWGGVLAMPISIGVNQYFNALYTALFNFYFDYGIAGVLFSGFFLGVACSATLSATVKKGGISLLFVSSMLFMISMLSSLTWKLAAGPVVLVMVIGLFIGLAKPASSMINRINFIKTHV